MAEPDLKVKRKRALPKSKTSLAIVERAYRAPIEEQYGHILWLSRVLRKMKGKHDILLKGQAVYYARHDQVNVTLNIGGLCLSDLSNYKETLLSFMKEGGKVYAYQNDLSRYLIQDQPLLDGITVAVEDDLVDFFEQYECIWYW